jgi:predicted RNA binding protein YcfA (HicA-like mRNA interferase family)
MRLPRDISGPAFVAALGALGYRVSRQTGSHARLTTMEHGEHHVTIPMHASLRVGTLSSVLADVADHFQISRNEITERLFGK